MLPRPWAGVAQLVFSAAASRYRVPTLDRPYAARSHLYHAPQSSELGSACVSCVPLGAMEVRPSSKAE